MKKLFFLLCFVGFLGFAGNAQAVFLQSGDAIEALKMANKDLVHMDVSIDLPAALSASEAEASALRNAKIHAVHRMVEVIPDLGNNANAVEAVFSGAYFTDLSNDQVDATRSFILGVVSKQDN